MANVRITKIQKPQENALATYNAPEALEQWLELSIKDLEHRLRYSKEETQVVQGALRALDDLAIVLKSK